MNLPGRLSGTTLGDLLGALHRAGATGVLELREASGSTAGRRHRLHLDGGMLTGVDSPMRWKRLGELLAEQGLVRREVLDELGSRLAQAEGRRAGELLVESGAVRAQAVAAALRHQLRSRLDALFSLGDSFVSFHVAARRPERSLPLSAREFLHGRPRARDRARQSPASASRQELQTRALRTLGLGPNAHADSARRAFRALAAQCHPDRFPHASAAQRETLLRRFAELSAAYHLLIAS